MNTTRPLVPSDNFVSPDHGVFLQICRAKAIAALDGRTAADRYLDKVGADRAGTIWKAAVSAGSAGSASFAGDLAARALGDFSETLGLSSAFFGMLNNNIFARAPLRTRFGVITTGATGYISTEALPAPISAVAVANGTLTEHTAIAIMVASEELIRGTEPSGQTLFSRELTNAIAAAVDAKMMAILLTGVSATATAGTSFTNAVTDLRTALAGVSTIGGKLAWILARDTARRASVLSTGSSFAFPDMSPNGGTMLNIPAFVSDGATAGTLTLVNGGNVLADSDSIETDASTNAALEFLNSSLVQDGTAGTGANLISTFQTNSVALRASVRFGLEKVRASTVAQITSVAWGG